MTQRGKPVDVDVQKVNQFVSSRTRLLLLSPPHLLYLSSTQMLRCLLGRPASDGPPSPAPPDGAVQTRFPPARGPWKLPRRVSREPGRNCIFLCASVAACSRLPKEFWKVSLTLVTAQSSLLSCKRGIKGFLLHFIYYLLLARRNCSSAVHLYVLCFFQLYALIAHQL